MQFRPCVRHFAFLSPDIAVTDSGHAYVIEVFILLLLCNQLRRDSHMYPYCTDANVRLKLNLNGFMFGSKYSAFFNTAQKDTINAMQLMGMPSYDRSGYEVCLFELL